MEKKELLEYFIDRDISELYGDFSDDGDGELELTDCGDEVAELIMEITDRAREEGYEKGVKDGLKGKVFKKVHLTEEYRPFKNRGEMEKRIDKLERVKPMALMGMMGEVAPQWVAKELNKIIDHLNSQDQVGDKYKILKEARLYPERTLGKLIKETLENTPEEINPYEKITKEYARAFAKDEEKEDIKRLREEVKDTPEEWEEDFRGFLDFVIEDDSNKKEVVEYVKNLLDERETKAFNEGVKEMEDSEQIQADWDIEELGNIVDKIVKKLDKLTTK